MTLLHTGTEAGQVFGDFLEGTLHVQEVARSHPRYRAAHLYAALSEQAKFPYQPRRAQRRRLSLRRLP